MSVVLTFCHELLSYFRHRCKRAKNTRTKIKPLLFMLKGRKFADVKISQSTVMIKHLREQQARLEVEAEAASVLRIKQTRLEETIKTLHKDLKEAKKSHTPEMRHFEELHEKITQIEEKHSKREQELQEIIRNSKLNASIEVEKEVDKWRKLVDSKNNEIQRFRMELDSILEVLRVLQKQGVIIPVSSTAVS